MERLRFAAGLLVISALWTAGACNDPPRTFDAATPTQDAGLGQDHEAAWDQGVNSDHQGLWPQQITGLVVDTTSQAVSTAQVRCENMLATTDEAGRFGFASTARSAPRSLRVRANGFLPAERKLQSQDTARVDVGAIILQRANMTVSFNGNEGGSWTSTDGKISLTVPAGAFAGAIDLSLATLPLEDPLRWSLCLPTTLPDAPYDENSQQNPATSQQPLFGLVIDANDQQPQKPLVLKIRVAIALPLGTEVPVGRYDPDEGNWRDVGLARVEEAETLQFSTSHLSTFVAALPRIAADATRAPMLDSLQRAVSPFMRGDPRVDPRSGTLQLGVPLPRLWRRGTPWSLSLFYDNRTLAPKLFVPIATPDATQGEKFQVQICNPLGRRIFLLNSTEDASSQFAPATLIPFLPAPPPAHLATENDAPPSSALLQLASGSYRSRVCLSRYGPALLTHSQSGSFTNPVAGEKLRDMHEDPVVAAPMRHSRKIVISSAVDNRENSPFGRGWHLQGLTRLLQPWCHGQQLTLVGSRDWPALTFGKIAAPSFYSLAPTLSNSGVQPSELSHARVAWVDGMIYIALPERNEIWKLSPGDNTPTLFAGGGSFSGEPGQGVALDLDLAGLQHIAPGPMGQGLLVGTQRYISLIDGEGQATRLVGTGADCSDDDLQLGESALNSTFCDSLAASFVADPSANRIIFSQTGNGAYELRDGILQRLRLREGSPHWHVFAINPQGQLFYSSDTGLCIYRFEDGLNDPELFSRCHETNSAKLQDGPANEALTGNTSAMIFDIEGNLWFFDRRFSVLRRWSPTEGVVTLSAVPTDLAHPGPTASGGLLTNTNLNGIESIAVVDAQTIFTAGNQAGDLGSSQALDDGRMLPLSTGDASVLQQIGEGQGWLRLLENGIVERYDPRGLLRSRGQSGTPALQYNYRGDWAQSQEQEACGRPDDPPLLESISLSGEALWTFRYSEGKLQEIEDAASRLVRRTQSGNSLSFYLPGEVNINFVVDESGKIIEQRRPGPNQTQDLWKFDWTHDRLSKTTSPDGHEHLWSSAEEATQAAPGTFDSTGLGQELQTRRPVAQIPVLGNLQAQLQLNTDGVSIESPGGEHTTLRNDAFGRLLQIEQADGSTLRLTRDAVGHVVELLNVQTLDRWRYRYTRVGTGDGGLLGINERMVAREDPLGNQTLWRFDDAGVLAERIDPRGSTIFESEASGVAQGLIRRILDPAGRRIEQVFDAAGNTTQIRISDASDPEQNMETHITRNQVGLPVQIQEPSGKILRYSYEPWGEIIERQVGPDDTGQGFTLTRTATGAWVDVAPDAKRAPVVSAVDDEGHSWHIDYLAGWKVTSNHSPVSGNTSYIYSNTHGKLREKQMSDGSRELISYDATGRLTERQWQGPSAGAGLIFTMDALGRILTMQDPLVVESRSYTPGLGWNRVNVSATSIGPQQANFLLQRERRNYATQEFVLGTQRTVLWRDFDNKIEKITQGFVGTETTELLHYVRDGLGRVIEINRRNGRTTHIEYDGLGRVVRQSETLDDTILQMTFSWSGNRPVEQNFSGNTRIFSWDTQGQLTACSDTGESYTYDRSGARSSSSGTPLHRDIDGRLVDDGFYSYRYDSLGRRTQRLALNDPADRLRYSYGAGGRLAKIWHGLADAEQELASYQYDGMGRRISKTTSQGTWVYGYQPDSERLLRVVSPDGTIWQLVHGRRSAAWTVAIADDGRERYVHLDPFQRVIGISDETGQFDPIVENCFGERLQSRSGDGPDIGMHGMPYDVESGLYAAGARYYDPQIGAFLSPDPLGLGAAPNLYAYAGGDPVLGQDPGGRFIFVALGALAVGGLVFNEIRKLAQSADAKRARQSYARMADVATDDSALGEAQQAHERLNKVSKKAGQTAVKLTVKASQSVINPAENLSDLKDSVQDLAESVLDEGSSAEADVEVEE